MRIKSLKLNDTTIENNVFIAPMAGYTDFAFRNLEIDCGAGLTFTELVSAKGLFYGGKGSKDLLRTEYDSSNEQNSFNYVEKTAAQIFGSDPFYMRAACESEDLRRFSIIDLNMGCPVPKVFKNGEGSALLTDIKKAEKIVAECVKSGKIITIKIRTGIKYGDDVAADFAKMAENAGASLVTVHGRVREAYYSGEPDYDAVAKAKAAVKIPIIANGGIFNEKDANAFIDRTGADGVMLARGALSNPFLVSSLVGKEHPFSFKQFILKQLDTMRSYYGDIRAAAEFKKFAPYYLKEKEGSKAQRIRLMQCADAGEMQRILVDAL